MSSIQFFLFYVWGVIGFASLLGVPYEHLAGAAFVGGRVSAAGLALEALDA